MTNRQVKETILKIFLADILTTNKIRLGVLDVLGVLAV
jgi:hypothetical protein